MKKTLFALMLALAVISPGFSQELISLEGSNQFQTTVGFEMNEYDYLINPLYFSRLTSPWIFFGMDGDVNQLASDIVPDGISVGWALGGAMTPVFLLNYSTASDLQSSPDINISVDNTTYDPATGTYASVTETVNQNLKKNHFVHDLVLHGGLSLSDTLALALQFAMAMDTWKVQSIDYINTYTNTAAPSPATLTGKGNLTETTLSLRDEDGENSYKMDIEAGLDTGSFSSRIVLGLGWYYPGSAGNTQTKTVTSYNGGLDPTVRDQVAVTTYTGQYYYRSWSPATPVASFSMTGAGLQRAEFFRIALDTDNTLPLGEELNLLIPFSAHYNIYSPALSTVYRTITVSYNDADAATNPETGRDETTVTTGLVRSLDLTAATGAGIAKTVHPTENTQVHLGAELDFEFVGVSDRKTQQRVRHVQTDNDNDAAYTTAGTDIDYTYTESGYEVLNRQFDYNFDLSTAVAVSYSPVNRLTFHAGAVTIAELDLTSVSTLTTGNSGYVYEQYTDNLDATNTYLQRQIDGSSTESTPSSSFTSVFDFDTYAFFGFTLDFSEAFRIDARATAGDVGFEEFSVLGMYSY